MALRDGGTPYCYPHLGGLGELRWRSQLGLTTFSIEILRAMPGEAVTSFNRSLVAREKDEMEMWLRHIIGKTRRICILSTLAKWYCECLVLLLNLSLLKRHALTTCARNLHCAETSGCHSAGVGMTCNNTISCLMWASDVRRFCFVRLWVGFSHFMRGISPQSEV